MSHLLVALLWAAAPSADEVRITCLGPREVSGSAFLLEYPGGTVLVDCGAAMESDWSDREARELREPYRGRVEAILLTHAHADHAGELRWWLEGRAPPVWMTPSTQRILRATMPPEALRTSRVAAYGERVALPGGAVAIFHDAGHIPGSASVEVRIPREPGAGWFGVVFSGDLGPHREDRHVGPPRVPDEARADVVVIESTYGHGRGRERPTWEDFRTWVDRQLQEGRRVFVPASQTDRAQVVLAAVNGMTEDRPPVWLVGSRMEAVTRVYGEGFDPPVRGDFALREGDRCVEERDVRLRDLPRPVVVIAADSSMQYSLWDNRGFCRCHQTAFQHVDEREALALVMWAPPDSPAGRLAERPSDRVRDFRPLFSAHADQRDLVGWAWAWTHGAGTVLVTHGPPEGRRGLQEAMGDWWRDVRDLEAGATHVFALGVRLDPGALPGPPPEGAGGSADQTGSSAERPPR